MAKMSDEMKKKLSDKMKAKYAARRPINSAARVVFHNWVDLNGNGKYGVNK